MPNLTWLKDPRGVYLMVVRSELSILRTQEREIHALDTAGVKNSPPINYWETCLTTFSLQAGVKSVRLCRVGG